MATQTTQRTLTAVVVSAGLMQKTVKVRIGTQQWNSHIRKVDAYLPFPLFCSHAPLSFQSFTLLVLTPFNHITNSIRLKHFNRATRLLVHDPASSLRTGDVIMIQPGWRVSKHVHHVVSSIIAPFGTPIEERPPVPTEEERLRERARRKAEKDARKLKRLAEGEGAS
jgi:small subunit ribosomal protein S17